jgi:hypothetical protein
MMSDFDPSKRVAVLRKDIDRAQFWFTVRVYLKVTLILGIPFVLALWVMLEYWKT